MYAFGNVSEKNRGTDTEKRFHITWYTNHILTLLVMQSTRLIYLSVAKTQSALVEQFMSRLVLGSTVYDPFYWNNSPKAGEKA